MQAMKKKVSSGLDQRHRDQPVTTLRGIVGRTHGTLPIGKFQRTYAVSSEMVSRLTGASIRTVSYWKAGTAPQGTSQQKLNELVRLFDALSGIVQSKAIGPWLLRPNPAFEGSTPLQVIERGESDRIWKMIWELREGHSG